VTVCGSTVGHRQDGVVPGTTTVRRAGSKPAAVTSMLYVPAVPGSGQGEPHTPPPVCAPVTSTVAPCTGAPVAASINVSVMAIGMGQGGIRHLPSPHEARAMVLAASIARIAGVLSGLRLWWDVLIARTSPHLVTPSAPFGTVVEVS